MTTGITTSPPPSPPAPSSSLTSSLRPASAQTKSPRAATAAGRRRGSKAAVTQPKSPAKTQFGPTAATTAAGSKFEMPPRPEVLYREQSAEDYSDLVVPDSDDAVLFDRTRLRLVTQVPPPRPANRSPEHVRLLQHASSTGQDSPQLFHPSDLTSLPRSMTQYHPPLSGGGGGSARRPPAPRPSVLPDRPMRRTRSSVEIERFAEDAEDEDFSDIFGPDDGGSGVGR